MKQGNQRDMRKIQVTRQFFEPSGPQDHFFEKTKKLLLDNGLCVPNFRSVLDYPGVIRIALSVL